MQPAAPCWSLSISLSLFQKLIAPTAVPAHSSPLETIDRHQPASPYLLILSTVSTHSLSHLSFTVSRSEEKNIKTVGRLLNALAVLDEIPNDLILLILLSQVKTVVTQFYKIFQIQ